MLKMNYICVIACLGLLFGTSVESVPVSAEVSPTPGSENNSSPALCENCGALTGLEGVSSAAELPQPQDTSTKPTVILSANASPAAEKDTSKVAPNTSSTVTTSEGQSHSIVKNASDNSLPINGANDFPNTLKPTDDASTTVAPTTTVKPATTPSSTVEPSTTTTPTTEKTSTSETPTSSEKPTTPVTPVPTSSTTSAVPSTSPTVISTKATPTTQVPTDKPAEERRFDGPSFIGGIVFALGVTAIAFVAWKFYKARTERNYHTL